MMATGEPHGGRGLSWQDQQQVHRGLGGQSLPQQGRAAWLGHLWLGHLWLGHLW